jgi:hypothetical protein
MEHASNKSRSRYLLALSLLRRKALRVVTPRSSALEDAAILHVEVSATGAKMTIAICDIAPHELLKCNEELHELLYCEVDPDVLTDGESA